MGKQKTTSIDDTIVDEAEVAISKAKELIDRHHAGIKQKMQLALVLAQEVMDESNKGADPRTDRIVRATLAAAIFPRL